MPTPYKPEPVITDADRYAWIRKAYVDFDDDDICNEALTPLGLCYTPEEVDAAIDGELRKPENAHLLQSCRAGDGNALDASALAEKLTAELFSLGSFGPDDSCNRLQFMLGQYDVNERPGGGLNRRAFQAFAERVIAAAAPAVSAPVGDPLQGAADWLRQALVNCAEVDLQQRLLIGFNRAARLMNAEATPPVIPFADGESPCVLEWGAVSLPVGDPSRVTNLMLCRTLWDAIAEGALCGFDWRVYPLADVANPAAIQAPATAEGSQP